MARPGTATIRMTLTPVTSRLEASRGRYPKGTGVISVNAEGVDELLALMTPDPGLHGRPT